MTTKRVLIIDDDRDHLQSLGIRLRAAGYQVSFAVDGVQATSAVRKESPDLIILDIGLPGGDGFIVIGRLKALAVSCGLPIIALSARDPESHEKRMLDAGAAAYFQKPADNAALLGKIRELLGEGANAA